MPRYPAICAGVRAVRLSAFSSLGARLERHGGERYPFHVGDTWMAPAVGCRMEDLRESDHPGMHRYAPTRGLRELLDAVVERTRRRTGAPTERDDVLISAGATGGLSAVLGALLSPGDEVVILAPFWPLIDGIVRSFRGEPVAVPLLDAGDDVVETVARLDRARTSRTVAVYVNATNNPTGRVVSKERVEAIVAWARRHDLWILSDEVYEDYAYVGEHIYCRPLAPERTFSVHSCSKAFAATGWACIAVPPRARRARCAPSAPPARAGRCGLRDGGQPVRMGRRADRGHGKSHEDQRSYVLQHTDRLADRGRGSPRRAGRRRGRAGTRAVPLDRSRVGREPPEGSTFLFLDVSHRLGPDGLGPLLEACADRGILVAPGTSFGPYTGHVRVCFTSAPPDVTRRGMTALAAILRD